MRPENVSVHSAAASTAENVFEVPANIRDVTYLGAGWRVTLTLPDGQSLLATIVRGNEIAGDLGPGKSVIARWAPASVAVLPAEGSS
ncbi:MULTISPECIES: TOBE domain-containing protein [unclassified Neorhizobium]|uniref:TOBE domain-containing protein n=1 Tax=unclassified Neorhizobium TaxID=2629175 RepID=UPI00344D4198